MVQDYYMLKIKEEAIGEKMKSLIIKAINENNGRITFEKDENEDEYPLTTILSGRKDIYFISITDVYLGADGFIYADGIDDDTTYKRNEFQIETKKYSDILFFIPYVLGWDNNAQQLQVAKDTINTNIMEMSCELAEKEMVDRHNWLPEAFMDESGENYTEDFQDEFNPLFDKYYNRIADLANLELR